MRIARKSECNRQEDSCTPAEGSRGMLFASHKAEHLSVSPSCACRVPDGTAPPCATFGTEPPRPPPRGYGGAPEESLELTSREALTIRPARLTRRPGTHLREIDRNGRSIHNGCSSSITLTSQYLRPMMPKNWEESMPISDRKHAVVEGSIEPPLTL